MLIQNLKIHVENKLSKHFMSNKNVSDVAKNPVIKKGIHFAYR